MRKSKISILLFVAILSIFATLIFVMSHSVNSAYAATNIPVEYKTIGKQVNRDGNVIYGIGSHEEYYDVYMCATNSRGNSSIEDYTVLNWHYLTIKVVAKSIRLHQKFVLYKEGVVVEDRTLSGCDSQILYEGSLDEGNYKFFFHTIGEISQDNYEVCYYSFNFSIDLTAPSYELRTNNSQLTNGMQTNESFEYHAWGDDFQRLYYKSPSANIYSSTTETFFFVEACESNTGIWSFYAIDVVGNKSETVTVYLDCKPPQISLANKMKFGTTVGDDIIVSAFDDIGPAKLYIKFESEEWFSSENNYTISKTERNGKYYFYAEDGNGNRTDINWIILSTEDPVGNLIKSDTDNSRYFFWNNEYWSATLDGEVYLEGTLISNEGQHEIILSNNAFKTKSYSFVIEHCYKIVEKREATCFENGIVRYECSQCKNSYEEVDYTSGHNYIISTIPPTCTEYENITYTCNLCGKKYEKKGNYPTGHSYLETVTVEPTCIKDGERKSKCEFCGVEYLTKIAASGHTYKITDTSTQDGKTTRTYTCMKCGDNYKQELGNQYDEVFDYVEYLFEQYCPYMLWVLLASSGIWSIVIGVMIAIAHKNEEKEKAKKMLINFVIGLVVIAVIVVACPYLIRGIAALVT